MNDKDRCKSCLDKLRCKDALGHPGVHYAPVRPSHGTGYMTWGVSEPLGEDSAPFVPGSASSRAAAKRLAPHLKAMRFRVYECIRKYPGATDLDISKRLKMKTARSRRIELERKGLVVWTGKTKAGKRSLGASAQTWQVTAMAYPEKWAERPQVRKTRTGEARVRRALDRAFPKRTKRLEKQLEKLVQDVVGKNELRRRILLLRPAVTRAMFVRLMLYILR
jgi:hypothetical protein